jgi:hypothetical protein
MLSLSERRLEYHAGTSTLLALNFHGHTQLVERAALSDQHTISLGEVLQFEMPSGIALDLLAEKFAQNVRLFLYQVEYVPQKPSSGDP